MIIGVPKEIKNSENRIGMTPTGVAELVKRGHTVYVQSLAGANSGFSNEAYTAYTPNCSDRRLGCRGWTLCDIP